MTDIHHWLWEIQGRLTALEHKLDKAEREVQRIADKFAKPARSPWIIETLLSPPVLKIIGGAALLGAGIKLEQAGEIMQRLLG